MLIGSPSLFGRKVQVSVYVINLFLCSNSSILYSKTNVFKTLVFRLRYTTLTPVAGFKDGGQVIVPVHLEFADCAVFDRMLFQN